MKKDKLEQYITDHREDFDIERAPVAVWQAVEQELDQKKISRRSLYGYIRVAAVGVVLLACGILVGLQIGDKPVSAELQEFAQAEAYYTKQVEVKWSALQETGVETHSVAEDLAQLDAVYAELKSELLKNQNSNADAVLNALLETYQTKVEILETVIEKTNSKSIHNLKINDDEVEEI